MNSNVVCVILILFTSIPACLCEISAVWATGADYVNITQSNTTDIDWIIGIPSSCTAYFLNNTLPNPGDTSEIITFSDWKSTIDNTSQVYRIEVLLGNQNENDNISFSLVRLLDSCGNIITSSNITNTTKSGTGSSGEKVYSTTITIYDLNLNYSTLGGVSICIDRCLPYNSGFHVGTTKTKSRHSEFYVFCLLRSSLNVFNKWYVLAIIVIKIQVQIRLFLLLVVLPQHLP